MEGWWPRVLLVSLPVHRRFPPVLSLLPLMFLLLLEFPGERVHIPHPNPDPNPSSAGVQVSGIFFSVEGEPRVRVAKPNLRCVPSPDQSLFWGSGVCG